MLAIYQRDGAYFVAFHEFVKSIMLGDRKYYKEAASPVMNVFDCGANRNSSHFTALRLLAFLLARRGEASSKEGQGYYEIGRLVSLCEDVFDNREDAIRSLNRLVERQLIEVNTRSTDSIDGASHARATAAGWYYSRFLVGQFSYLDLVLQDTPISDPAVEQDLRKSVDRVDNLADPEGERLERMSVRFGRVARFLAYLDAEERADHLGRDLQAIGGVIGARFMPELLRGFEDERAWIERRLIENRERVREDRPTGSLADGIGDLAREGKGTLFEQDEESEE